MTGVLIKREGVSDIYREERHVLIETKTSTGSYTLWNAKGCHSQQKLTEAGREVFF
jgi:hypothetical protein